MDSVPISRVSIRIKQLFSLKYPVSLLPKAALVAVGWLVCAVGGANAQTPECGGIEFIRNVMLSQKHKFSYFTLQKNQIAKYTLFVTHNRESDPNSQETTPSMPWVLIEHQPNDWHCFVGKGDTLEALVSLHTTNPSHRFGMPGSGNPRCSQGTDALQQIEVRLWANRELGNSTVFYLHSIIGDNFTVLMSIDGYWILLNTETNNPLITCYYARGDSIINKTMVPRNEN